MNGDVFDNVWDAIEDSPGSAAIMRLKSALTIELEQHIRTENLSQAQAAKAMGVSEARISKLLGGKISSFDLETLVAMAGNAGRRIEIHFKNQ